MNDKAKRTLADKRALRAFGEGNDPSPLIEQLGKEIVRIKHTMADAEARLIVRKYFDIQRMRIGIRLAQGSAAKRDIPNDILMYLGDQTEMLEKELQRLLLPYVKASEVGRWMLGVKGIGPVIAAGMLSEFKIERAPTAGRFLSFAGQCEGQKLVKGQLRTWNAHLKVVCYYAGEAFVKVANREGAYYGNVYKWRKMYEWKKNLAGEYAAYAEKMMVEKTYASDTHAYAWYTGQYSSADFRGQFIIGKKAEDGNGIKMLPPAQIHARSKKYAVRMFIYHLHHVWYESVYKQPPPLPYPLAHQGHTDFYPPPSWTVAGIPVATAPWEAEFVMRVRDPQAEDDGEELDMA